MTSAPGPASGLEVPADWWARLGHDLRGPISPMRMALQLLKSGRISPGDQVEAVQMVDRQLDQLLARIDDISELLRMNCEGFALNFTVDDLNLVIDAVSGRSSIHKLVEAAGQSLQCQAAGGAVSARHDPQRLLVLLEYLVGKLSEHAPPGARLAIVLRDGAAGPEFLFSGGSSSLAADPDLAHIAGTNIKHCDERQARALRMREIVRLGATRLTLGDDGSMSLRLPAP
jgi:signal transduction histidine kinase